MVTRLSTINKDAAWFDRIMEDSANAFINYIVVNVISYRKTAMMFAIKFGQPVNLSVISD